MLIFMAAVLLPAFSSKSPPKKTLNPPPEEMAEKSKKTVGKGTKLKAHVKVSWGYGCGGHCAFNFRGKSDLSIKFLKGHSVLVKDAGEFLRMENYPDGHADEKRVWKFSWKGSWKEEGGSILLKLKSSSLTCKETRSSDKEKKTKKCSTVPSKIKIKCAAQNVEVYKKMPDFGKIGKPELKEALVCKPQEDLLTYSGTEFPWVFGLDTEIFTIKSGEPEPETYYVMDAGDDFPM